MKWMQIDQSICCKGSFIVNILKSYFYYFDTSNYNLNYIVKG